MKSGFKILDDLLFLFYPDFCIQCNTNLVQNEQVFCTMCELDLPASKFNSLSDNDVAQLFWGRVPIENTYAHLKYYKEGITQKLLHAFKYKGRRDIGKVYGKKLAHVNALPWKEFDMLVPVPLHPKKQKLRGYNQSTLLCKGIAQVHELPVIENILLRKRHSGSQTQKNRYDRFVNMQDIFALNDKHKVLNEKHVLLVDDVITTGSTIESCTQLLLDAGASKVSVLALAYACY